MKACDDCKYAEWDRTATGRLHPSKGGRCRYEWKMPPLPACLYWIGAEPKPAGWRIERGQQHQSHCPYYGRKD